MLISNKLNITYNAIFPNGRSILNYTESNAVRTEILTYSISKTIRSDKSTARVGENVRNTVNITNHSDTKLFHNYFIISQPNDANPVAGSVKVNGIAQPTYNPLTGFALPDLDPDETVVIEYEIKAHKPTPTPVTHFATLRYNINDPVRGNVNYSENTDMLSLNVISDKLNNAIQTVIWIPNNNGRNVTRELICCCDCCNCFDCNDYCNCCNDCSDI